MLRVRRTAALLIVIASLFITPSAQASDPPGEADPVPELATVIAPVRTDYAEYRAVVLADATLSVSAKETLLKSRRDTLAQMFSDSRMRDYHNYRLRLVASGQCTNQGGSPKFCKGNCTTSPSANLATRVSSTEVYYGSNVDMSELAAGKGVVGNADELVRDNGSTICSMDLKQSGQGKKLSYVIASFRYRPEAIAALVKNEILALLSSLTSCS